MLHIKLLHLMNHSILCLLQVVKKTVLYLFSLLYAISVPAQVKVTMINDTLRPERLVREYFLGKGIKVSNIKFKGEADAFGVFTDSAMYTGLEEGIVISTGRVELLQGNNSRPNAGANFGRHFFFDENLVTKAMMCDGATLELDFVPIHDSIAFRFVFGSEEYPEFVGKNFNDVFAFYLSPKKGKYVKPKNIGTLPNGTTVMINNVNHKRNNEWYVANDKFDDPLYQKLEYDGLTKPIVAASRVIPMQPYHLKIIIADLEDCEYDSGVLLEAQSFSSYSTKKPKPVKRNYFFGFESSSFKLEQTEIRKVKLLTDSLLRFSFDSIIIIGHTDSTGDETLNKQLSYDRANTIAGMFKNAGIKAGKIRVDGKGSSMPLQSNKTEKGKAINRRVEILFYRKLN
jgi:outer membrane protein OmpA-like peptidoglycan-associated protein